jgi:glyoxylase-like metal-dependent hydrolase (beta-lactamase superfamily II)
MKITAMLAAIVVLGAFSASAQNQQDFSQIQIKATKINEKFYTLEGQGGTIGALIGPDGVFIVDTQFAPLTPKIVAALKQITPNPIRFAVNTHVHGDHTGGNENLGKMGVTIFSRDQLRSRLARPGGNAAPAPAPALPVVTYNDAVTLHMNGEDIQLIPVRAAHTDGDTLVRFTGLDVIMTGDYFRTLNYPNIDRANGGTLNGLIEGLGQTIGLTGPNTKVIPGHGPITDRNGLIAHRDMVLAVRDRVAQLIREGKTSEQVVAAKPTSDWDSKVGGSTAQVADRFVGQVFAELSTAR